MLKLEETDLKISMITMLKYQWIKMDIMKEIVGIFWTAIKTLKANGEIHST